MGVMKLKNLIHQSFQKRQLIDQKKFAQDYKILDAYLSEMFPNHSDWKMVIANLNDHDDHRQLVEKNLPFHTRDNVWLTKYARQVVHSHKYTANLNLSNARRFVEYSAEFDNARNLYEQNLTKGEIEYLLQNCNQRMIPSEFMPRTIYNKPDYDSHFRHAVLDEMNLLGVNLDNAELALEVNADLWRKSTMIKSFRNQFYPSLANLGGEFFPNLKGLEDMQAHQEVWLKLREYAYYFYHKDIVDAAGSHTDAMLLKPNEVLKLMHQEDKYRRKFEFTFGPKNDAEDTLEK